MIVLDSDLFRSREDRPALAPVVGYAIWAAVGAFAGVGVVVIWHGAMWWLS